MNIYLINLDRDVERMQHMAEQLQRLGLDYTRVAAVEGRLLSDDWYADFCQKIQRTDWPKGGQLGCFLSHFAVWEQIANQQAEYALVLEDDVHLASDLSALVKHPTWIPADTDIVRLEVSTNKLLLATPAIHVFSDMQRSLNQLLSTAWCAGAYVMSKRCAQRLIQSDPRQFQSVDAFLFSHEDSALAKTLTLYQLQPAVAVQDKFSPFQPQHPKSITRFHKKGFASNIEVDAITQGIHDLKVLFRQLNLQVIVRWLKGYQRIPFRE